MVCIPNNEPCSLLFHLIPSSKQMENGSQILYLNSDDRLDYDTTVCYLGVFL